MSRSTTATPWATRAEMAASRTNGPDGRESRPKTTFRALPSLGVVVRLRWTASAEAIRMTVAGVSVPPIVPRIPETPIINASMHSPNGTLVFAPRHLVRGLSSQSSVRNPHSPIFFMDRTDLNRRLPGLVDAVVHSVTQRADLAHLNRVYLPSRDSVIEALSLLRQLAFPGFFGKPGITTQNLPYRVGELMS